MKIAALVVLGSALILTSCGKKGDDKKSDSTTTDSTAQGGVIKEGTLVNGNIDLHKVIRGTSWTLSKIVDHENKELVDAKITELSFDKDKNVLNIKNSNGNVNMCGIKTGGKYVLVKSSVPNEYLIQDFNSDCSTISAGGKIIPSMAIIKINKDNSISIYRQSLTNFYASNGKLSPSVIQTESYTKK